MIFIAIGGPKTHDTRESHGMFFLRAISVETRPAKSGKLTAED
jgi:hypothetical protein